MWAGHGFGTAFNFELGLILEQHPMVAALILERHPILCGALPFALQSNQTLMQHQQQHVHSFGMAFHFELGLVLVCHSI